MEIMPRPVTRLSSSSDDGVDRVVVGGRGRDRHRRCGDLLRVDLLADLLLAQESEQDGVADARVGQVVATKVCDRGHHPALDDRHPGDVGGEGDGRGDDTADVGREAAHAGQPNVVVDDALHRELDVAVVVLEVLLGGRGRAWERPDADDRVVQRLPDHGGGHAWGGLDDPGCEPASRTGEH
jgi:hypothetical protein